MNTPIAIVFFNRLAPLKRLVSRLAEIKPLNVYLISDGPRDKRKGDAKKVEACRNFMVNLPWSCNIKTNFSSVNLGCRRRVTSGIDWVLENEDRVIILEDDCVPEKEFFPWVERMLDRYENDMEVFSVSGMNLRPQLCCEENDAVFSKYSMIWGWATWRRSWRKNDKDLERFPEACKKHIFKKWLGKWRAEWYWRYLLTHVKTSWGYRWAFTHFVNNAYCVLPPVCLVENVGMMDSAATHTSDNPYELPKVEKNWVIPACAPEKIYCNEALDCWIDDNFFSRSFGVRIKWLLRKLKKILIKR